MFAIHREDAVRRGTLNFVIHQAEQSPQPVQFLEEVISKLNDDYENNTWLINELLYFKFDLLGM